jgi:MFS family permease
MFGRFNGSRFWRMRRGGLWSNADFKRLWAAESISQVGSQITLVALPLAAALSLGATPAQMGMLTAAGTLPFLLLSLFAGVWVDRMRRRSIMIATDVGRAMLLLAVPAAWALDLLRIELLFIVAFFVGVQTLFFDIAYLSFLPGIVRRDQLTEGNAKLQGSASTAQVAGPGMAGLLVGLITAPMALVVDALSYLLSAWFLIRIRTPEAAPQRQARPDIRREIGEGLRAIFGNALLRAIAISAAVGNLFGYVFLAVYILYMVEELGFSATEIGLVFSLGGAGAIVGTVIAEPLKRRIGVGPAIIAGRVMFGVGGLLVPLAVLVPRYEVPMVLGAEFLQWAALLVAIVNEVSLRQALVPERLLGRANGTMRLMNQGVVPLGAMAGGLLGEMIGLRATLIVGVAGMFVAAGWVLFSPLRGVSIEPEQGAEMGVLSAAEATAVSARGERTHTGVADAL